MHYLTCVLYSLAYHNLLVEFKMSVTINFINNNFEFKMVIKQLWQFLAMFSCRTVALLKKNRAGEFQDNSG